MGEDRSHRRDQGRGGLTPPDQPAEDDAAAARGGAFFGRRKGHPLRTRQSALFETLLPRLAIDLTEPAPADLTALFARGVTGVRLEIGFGGGEHMAGAAMADPSLGIIGCEAFVNGMAKALALIEDNAIANVRLHFGDAIEMLAWLPENSLAGIDLLYPDPWPKRRHWKRRFVQSATVAAFARLIEPGGLFRFASDVPDYAAWTLQHLGGSPQFCWTAERADDWRLPWPGYHATRYEAKARREGRASSYLAFRRM